MANSAQARKRARTRNAASTMPAAFNGSHLPEKVDAAIEAGVQADAGSLYCSSSSFRSYGGQRHYPQNKAARHKSRLNAQIKALGEK